MFWGISILIYSYYQLFYLECLSRMVEMQEQGFTMILPALEPVTNWPVRRFLGFTHWLKPRP